VTHALGPESARDGLGATLAKWLARHARTQETGRVSIGSPTQAGQSELIPGRVHTHSRTSLPVVTMVRRPEKTYPRHLSRLLFSLVVSGQIRLRRTERV